ncbi:hypothetical protein [Phycicoccus duodecadis]|uniref:Uncharacterized protein n=1 Tax=Phycicoccus duodecadis TaxID=173053 RepID=A0A2N3YFX1_9MICO|nr:hypothetical protein [Phycicoccus duodecadis]PKW25751.1 hypothetical protein ATL31_0551 [Phycicoccus duodecadis]
MAIYVNGQLLREALLRNAYTDREFCRITGMGQSVLRMMLFENAVSPGIAISDIVNCARAAGVSLDDLLTEPLPEPSTELEDDAVLLARTLTAIRKRQPTRRLAAALGWDLTHTHAVIQDLRARLEPLGLDVTIEPDVAITARGSGLAKITTELNRRRDNDDSLHHGAARTLYKIMTGNLGTRELPNDTQVQIGALANRGAIIFGESGPDRFTLSPDLRFALLDTAPSPTQRPPRPR